MLRDLDLSKYQKVIIATGFTDLRLGARGLVNLIQYKYGLDFYDQSSIFMFCGRKAGTYLIATPTAYSRFRQKSTCLSLFYTKRKAGAFRYIH